MSKIKMIPAMKAPIIPPKTTPDSTPIGAPFVGLTGGFDCAAVIAKGVDETSVEDIGAFSTVRCTVLL